MDKEYTASEAKAWLNGYDEGKRFAEKGLHIPLVRLEEFLTMIKGSESLRGRPVIRTEWPTEEDKK